MALILARRCADYESVLLPKEQGGIKDNGRSIEEKRIIILGLIQDLLKSECIMIFYLSH